MERTIRPLNKEVKRILDERKKSDPIFYETSKLLTRALDRVQYILQGNYTPKTKYDFAHLDEIRHNLFRAIRLAAEYGIDVSEVLEKMVNRHEGTNIKKPKHLRRPDNSIEDVEIVKGETN